MSKIYSEDFRFQAVACVKRGKSYEEICEFFGIGIATLYRWVKQEREEGNLKAKERGTYKTRKINEKELQEEIDNNPDTTLKELSKKFDCCFQAIDYWCRKLKITRKKNQTIRRKG